MNVNSDFKKSFFIFFIQDVEVDIETVDEWAINKVKDALKALKESG